MEYSAKELREWWNFLEDCLPDDDYPLICKAARHLGIKNIYEIGCAYGPHIGYILKWGFDYVGIDEHESHPLYDKRERFEDYKTDIRYGVKYPCELNPKPDSCAISVCALGSVFSEKEIETQMKQMTKEFKHFFCSTFINSLMKMEEYWQHHQFIRIPDDSDRWVAHFWND